MSVYNQQTPKFGGLLLTKKVDMKKKILLLITNDFSIFEKILPKNILSVVGKVLRQLSLLIKHLKNKSRQERRQITEKFFSKFLKNPDYYLETPFLSIAEELLKYLKEELISKLAIVSASNGKRKDNKFSKSFGKFSNAELSIQKPGCFKERKEHR